ncbi:hypothetical protein OHD16_06125 [Sphingobacterium sp. ML3W]|uniref:hypothetical protein n=1 Tax=Sphingobacterium sp. ML3W TaxID=1538644 RepID=UPI00249C36E0|nr:hypothetical protein [Sphingobacterium sp. ML3W]WFA79544.1 hypothetical protein OGI71_26365 [Sphingobacterium sp. ML3W]
MKKLKLNFINLGDAEVLSKDQLKKVLGGGYGANSGTYNGVPPTDPGSVTNPSNPVTDPVTSRYGNF